MTEKEIESLAIGQPCLWREGRLETADSEAIWFRVANLPSGWDADILLAATGLWAFLLRGKQGDYLSRGIYSSKEDALEGLKGRLREIV